jgi:hypothetical protein
MDPRAGVDDVEKRKFLLLPGLEFRLLGRPDRSQSLYRLSYPGSPPPNVYTLLIQVIYGHNHKVEPKYNVGCVV